MIDYELIQLIALKVIFAFLMVGAVMTMAGYSVLAERKVSAWMQGRVGPNRTVLPLVGHIPLMGSLLKGLGIFQPLILKICLWRGSEPFLTIAWTNRFQ